MKYDIMSLFSDAQAITASGPSANIMDLVDAPLRLGRYLYLWGVFAKVVTAFESDPSAALGVTLQACDSSDFASTPVYDIFTSSALFSQCVPGFLFPRQTRYLYQPSRFVRAYYTVTGGPASAGAITAGVSWNGSQDALR